DTPIDGLVHRLHLGDELASRANNTGAGITNGCSDLGIADHLTRSVLRHRAEHGEGTLPVFFADLGDHDRLLALLFPPGRPASPNLSFDHGGFRDHHGFLSFLFTPSGVINRERTLAILFADFGDHDGLLALLFPPGRHANLDLSFDHAGFRNHHSF